MLIKITSECELLETAITNIKNIYQVGTASGAAKIAIINHPILINEAEKREAEIEMLKEQLEDANEKIEEMRKAVNFIRNF